MKEVPLRKFVMFSFLRFWEMKLSGSKVKKFLMFSQKKGFPLFRETKTQKKFLTFEKTEFSYISGNKNPKIFFIFQEMESYIFQERTSKV